MKAPILASFLAALAVVALLAGCATVKPEQFNMLQSQVYNQQRKIDALQKDLAALQKQAEQARRPRAELVSEVASMRQDLQRLQGRVDEGEHRLGQTLSQKSGQEEAQRKAESAKVDQMQKRLARLEAYLGMTAGADKPPAGKPAPAPAAPAEPQPKDIYELGRRLYKQKSYAAARDRFEEYVKKYPKSKLADNALFWVGQTYYAQKKYEEAILAYNQMVKRYPKSATVPSALYKQGLAWRNLGDKRTAKIVLNKLIKSYPKSSQAKWAQKVLKKL